MLMVNTRSAVNELPCTQLVAPVLLVTVALEVKSFAVQLVPPFVRCGAPAHIWLFAAGMFCAVANGDISKDDSNSSATRRAK